MTLTKVEAEKQMAEALKVLCRFGGTREEKESAQSRYDQAAATLQGILLTPSDIATKPHFQPRGPL